MTHKTDELVQELSDGKMIILMDDEDRENEGDLVMIAQFVRAEDINFMARYGRGLICLTLTPEHCHRLKLPLMVSETNQNQTTNFTVSIEAAHGVTTGISAADRAKTVQAAVNINVQPEDLVQPGHIFPIMSQPGGVLTRAGHTEAGCDLARIAGFDPAAAVIVEILNEDGTMARKPELENFAHKHGLKIGTIADLIEYRLQRERTVQRVADCHMENQYGRFHLVCYQDQRNRLHYALVKGDLTAEDVLVRVHMQDPIGDWTQVSMPDGSWPLQSAMRKIGSVEAGVVLVLSNPYNNQDIIQRIRQFDKLSEKHRDKESHWDVRTFGIGAQILKDLGVHKMRVLSNPKKIHGLSGFGLEIISYEQCE